MQGPGPQLRFNDPALNQVSMGPTNTRVRQPTQLSVARAVPVEYNYENGRLVPVRRMA